MRHFSNIFYIIWNNHISRIVLLVFLGLILITLIDMAIESSKAKKKTKYTKSSFDMSDYHKEECELFKDEWKVEYTSIFGELVDDMDECADVCAHGGISYEEFLHRKGIYNERGLTEYDKLEFQEEYDRLY